MAQKSSATASSPRDPLSRDRVLRAALDLIDRDGADALTMRSLAKDLGVEAPSLYKHVPNKAAILDGICELIYAEVVMDDVGEAWEDRLRAYADGFRRALLNHQAAVPILTTRAVSTEGSMLLVEVALAEFARVGFDPETARKLLNVVVATITGMVLSEMSDQDTARRSFAEPEKFPLASATVIAAPADRDAEFDIAMAMLTEGISRRFPAT